jgi:hypothetical protein
MAWTATCGSVRAFPTARLEIPFSSGVQFRGGHCIRSRQLRHPAGRGRASLQTMAILERFLNFNKPKQGLEERRNQLKTEVTLGTLLLFGMASSITTRATLSTCTRGVASNILSELCSRGEKLVSKPALYFLPAG